MGHEETRCFRVRFHIKDSRKRHGLYLFQVAFNMEGLYHGKEIGLVKDDEAGLVLWCQRGYTIVFSSRMPQSPIKITLPAFFLL